MRPFADRRFFLRALTLALLALAVAVAAQTGSSAWRAADGATLWRGGERGGLGWELFDADGDGAPEVASFFAGPRYTRVEIDTNGDRVADRVHLFAPDGTVSSYLDADGDGVLETPAGSPTEQRRAIREIGRGGDLFRRALEMRFDADAGLLAAADIPAPAIEPPLKRPAGPAVKLRVRLTMIPAAPAAMLQRADDPAYLGEISISAPTAVGFVRKKTALHIRTDPMATQSDETGELDIGLYPVYVNEFAADGSPVRTLVVQIAGRVVRAGISPETFFLTARLCDASPFFAETPVRDLAGRAAGQIALEVVRTNP